MPHTVLIFDDEVVFSLIVKTVLKKKGIAVQNRDDCDNLIDVIKDINPNLILMDNKIPPKGGIEATHIIKSHEEFKNIPVIYFSAHPEINDLAKEAGADDCLSKPFELEELERIILKYIDVKNDLN